MTKAQREKLEDVLRIAIENVKEDAGSAAYDLRNLHTYADALDVEAAGYLSGFKDEDEDDTVDKFRRILADLIACVSDGLVNLRCAWLGITELQSLVDLTDALMAAEEAED